MNDYSPGSGVDIQQLKKTLTVTGYYPIEYFPTTLPYQPYQYPYQWNIPYYYPYQQPIQITVMPAPDPRVSELEKRVEELERKLSKRDK